MNKIQFKYQYTHKIEQLPPSKTEYPTDIRSEWVSYGYTPSKKVAKVHYLIYVILSNIETTR